MFILCSIAFYVYVYSFFYCVPKLSVPRRQLTTRLLTLRQQQQDTSHNAHKRTVESPYTVDSPENIPQTPEMNVEIPSTADTPDSKSNIPSMLYSHSKTFFFPLTKPLTFDKVVHRLKQTNINTKTYERDTLHNRTLTEPTNIHNRTLTNHADVYKMSHIVKPTKGITKRISGTLEKLLMTEITENIPPSSSEKRTDIDKRTRTPDTVDTPDMDVDTPNTPDTPDTKDKLKETKETPESSGFQFSGDDSNDGYTEIENGTYKQVHYISNPFANITENPGNVNVRWKPFNVNTSRINIHSFRMGLDTDVEAKTVDEDAENKNMIGEEAKITLDRENAKQFKNLTFDNAMLDYFFSQYNKRSRLPGRKHPSSYNLNKPRV